MSPAGPPVRQISAGQLRWKLALLLGLFGLLLNLAPVELFPGTELVFGGVAYLIAAVALGPAFGLLAALVASLPTLWLWNNPYALLIFAAEGWTVGYLVCRWDRRPLTADLIFWLVVGLPLLYLTYGRLLGLEGITAGVVFLKQPLNGLLAALGVEVLLLVPSVRRWLGIVAAPRLRSALAVVLALISVAPVLALGVWEGQREWRSGVQRAEERVEAAAEAYGARLEQHVRLHAQAVQSIARSAAARGVWDPAQLQRLVAAEREQFPGFVNVYAGDARGVAVAFAPPTNARGDTMIGARFGDRDYVRRLRETRQMVISDVFAGRGGADEPLVVIAAPVVLGDTLAGYVLGALDLRGLPRPRPFGSSERLRVADSLGVLVLDTYAPYRPGDQPRSVRGTRAFAAVRAQRAGGSLRYSTAVGAAPVQRTAATVIAGTEPIPSLGWWVWVEYPLAAVEAASIRAYAGLITLLVLLLLATIVLSGLLARWLARPLLRLRGVASALAAGDRGARVGVLHASVPAEIQELGRGFDEMAGSLSERAEELEEVGEIARSLASTLDSETLLHQITDAAARLVDADGCGIALLEDDGRTMRTADYNFGLLAAGAGETIPVEGSLAGWAARAGEPVLVPDVGADPRAYRDALLLREVGSALYAPLSGRSGPLGTLVGVRAHSRGQPFDETDLRLLERLARQAAIAVENARLIEEAQAASRAKSDFIATMSHELRTPLNAVLGHLQLLEMEIHGPVTPPQADALGRIGVAARHLRGLIEEVLSFARLEAGRAELNTAPTDLCALAGEVAAVIEPLAREKQLRFDPPACAAGEPVVTDGDKVRQVLINLAGNAVKFTETGEVRIRVEPRDAEVWIEVADTGPGISPEDQARLFRPFEQLQSGLDRAHGGTGLGLYLSRRYAALLGGRIELRSRVGEGSTFALVLPAPGKGGPAQ